MSKPLKLAFIGGAQLSSAVGYAHFVAAQMDQRWQLVAGCFSRDARCNQLSGQAYGVDAARVYADVKQLLQAEQGRVDAVAILTPTPTHAQWVMQCLQAGLPVICEKALAGDLDTAQTVAACLQAERGFLGVTYNYVGYPLLRALRAMIAAGELGRLLHVQVEMPQEGYLRVDAGGEPIQPQAWRLQDGPVPTIFLDLGVHVHHLIQYLTAEVAQQVFSRHSSQGHFTQVVDNVNASVRYAEPLTAEIWFSKCALGYRNGLRVRVLGSLGAADWVQMRPEELIIAYANGQTHIVDRSCCDAVQGVARYNRFKPGHPDGYLEAFANVYYDLADGLLQYRQQGSWAQEPCYGVEVAQQGLAMMQAMVASQQSGTWQIIE